MTSKIIDQPVKEKLLFKQGDLVYNPNNNIVFIVTDCGTEHFFKGVCVVISTYSAYLGQTVRLEKSYFQYFKGKILLEQ